MLAVRGTEQQEGIKPAFDFGSFRQQGIPGVPGLRWRLLCPPSPLVISALSSPQRKLCLGGAWFACSCSQEWKVLTKMSQKECMYCRILVSKLKIWENNSKEEFKKIHRSIVIPFWYFLGSWQHSISSESQQPAKTGRLTSHTVKNRYRKQSDDCLSPPVRSVEADP